MDERRMAGWRIEPVAIIGMMLATGLVLVLLVRVADDHPGGARWLLDLLRAFADLVHACRGERGGIADESARRTCPGYPESPTSPALVMW